MRFKIAAVYGSYKKCIKSAFSYAAKQVIDNTRDLFTSNVTRNECVKKQ